MGGGMPEFELVPEELTSEYRKRQEEAEKDVYRKALLESVESKRPLYVKPDTARGETLNSVKRRLRKIAREMGLMVVFGPNSDGRAVANVLREPKV